MTKLNNIGLVVLASLMSLPHTASAQSPSPDRPQGGGFVERLDRDGDGRVSADEFDGPAEHFSDLDKDGDGHLSENEAPQGPPPGRRQGGQGGQGRQGGGPGGFIERLDHDGDGRVSRDEFDGPTEHFSDLDRDGDGYLNEDEAPKGPPPGQRGGRRRGRRKG